MKKSSPFAAVSAAMSAALVAAWGAALGVALPAQAESASSAASSAGSASVGSLSDSVKGSSGASSGQRVAQGEYRIVQVALQPAAGGRVQLRLEARAAGLQDREPERLELLLPAEVVERHALDVGVGVQVLHERFGLAFSRTGDTVPFFLALDAGYTHEFQNRALRL